MATKTSQILSDVVSYGQEHQLYARNTAKGIAVFGSNGTRLGRIDHVMVDRISGEVVTAIVRVDGGLWFDSDRLSIPWSFLVFDLQLNGFVLGIGAPTSREAGT
jgi:sporulation protein YlmC with PRC-barrel domain